MSIEGGGACKIILNSNRASVLAKQIFVVLSANALNRMGMNTIGRASLDDGKLFEAYSESSGSLKTLEDAVNAIKAGLDGVIGLVEALDGTYSAPSLEETETEGAELMGQIFSFGELLLTVLTDLTGTLIDKSVAYVNGLPPLQTSSDVFSDTFQYYGIDSSEIEDVIGLINVAESQYQSIYDCVNV